MGPKRRRTKDPSEVDEDETESVGSQRSSARLERKRQRLSSATPGKALQFDALEEEHETTRRSSKRRKKQHTPSAILGDVEMTILEEEVLTPLAPSSVVPIKEKAVLSTVAIAIATTTTTNETLTVPNHRNTVPLPPSTKKMKPVEHSTIQKPKDVEPQSVVAEPRNSAVILHAPKEMAPDVPNPPIDHLIRTLGLDRTLGWLVVLLLLQLLLFPLWKQTIWAGTVAFSNVLLSVCRWTGVATAPLNIRRDIQEAMGTLDQLQLELQSLQEQEVRNLQSLQESMNADSEMDREERVASLTAMVQQLQEAAGDEDALEDLVSQHMEDDRRRHPKLINLIPFRRLVHRLVRKNRESPDATCEDVEHLESGETDSLHQQMSEQIESLQRNDTTHHIQQARAWIQREIQEQVRRFQKALDARKNDQATRNETAPLLALRRVIQDHFIRSSTLVYGSRIDYASVAHGGRIYASSPSLKDGLPLFNRLAAFWKLRFYGHGPEVILSPGPAIALGNCWSFAGSTGNVTIQLGQKISVDSVVVEHVAPQAQVAPSALRAFHVYGYETAKDVASTDGEHLLGAFEFDYAKAKGGRMEFPVRTKERVPSLQFIRLQIDSNWGNPDNYTCLYRVRVHGGEPHVVE